MNKIYNLLAVFVSALALSSCGQDSSKIGIIPYPNHAEAHCSTFCSKGADFIISPNIPSCSKEAIEAFASHLSEISGATSAITDSRSDKGFIFNYDESIPDEGYTLEISRKRAEIKASSYNGFLYAIESIKQLMPVAIYGSQPAADQDWNIQCASINDSPRFHYRGLHIDVARHFFDIDEVRKFIDIMAVHKMNKLHWHLTDDQGWRIEIKKYPRLTEIGSTRKSTMVKKNWKKYDGIPHGGYYTQEQIRDIIEYAQKKGVTIIPEIDLPGHMVAALASYPVLGCTGGPYEVRQKWGVSEQVICAGSEKALSFLEDVLDEVADLFPSDYIHIGGDECPKVAWEKCPTCQKKIMELGLEDDENYSAEHYLQSYVMERMEKHLAKKGKKVIGWDEILEGKPGPTATIMSWRGSEGGIKAAQMGLDAIMTPESHFYFDYYQCSDIDSEPLAIGGYIPLDKVYSYEPYTDEMDEEARKHIIGIQANLWTEYISTNDYLEYMLLPRASALSEVQWNFPESKNWERFRKSLDRMRSIYEIMGFNYSKTVFEEDGIR